MTITIMKAFILTLLVLSLTACSNRPHVIDRPVSLLTTESREIHIVSHGWHTGFVMPAKEIYALMPDLKKRFGNSLYIEFGWGDQGFYQAEKVTVGLALKAVLWPTDSVVHAVAVPRHPEQYFANSRIEKICLDSRQYSALVNFIESSFFRNRKNELVPLQQGIYGNSQFYRAQGDYYLLNTCNKWTAKGLRSAGLNISPAFKLSADSVMNWVAAYNQAAANEAQAACR